MPAVNKTTSVEDASNYIYQQKNHTDHSGTLFDGRTRFSVGKEEEWEGGCDDLAYGGIGRQEKKEGLAVRERRERERYGTAEGSCGGIREGYERKEGEAKVWGG